MDSATADPTHPWPVRRIVDPKELRALAHPIRFRILDLLAEGPLTASQCAERIGESPANCSYHLRQLAKFGHAYPSPGGHGRERYWRGRDEAIAIADDGPGGAVAARAVGDAIDEYRFEGWRRFVDRRAHDDSDWRDAALSTDVVSWLTADELRELKRDLHALFAQYADRGTNEASRPRESRAVRFFAYAYPGERTEATREAGEP